MFEAGRGGLAEGFADFDFRDDAARSFEGDDFVHAAEDGFAFRGDEPLADAEGVNRRLLLHEVLDEVFVQRVGNADDGVVHSGGVEHFPRAVAEVGKVAAVDADAAQFVAVRREVFLVDADGVRDALAQGVIGIDEQHGVVRPGFGVLQEGVVFAVVALYEGVRHGTGGGDAARKFAINVRGGDDAADVGGTGAVVGGIAAVGTAGAKFQHGATGSGVNDARRFGRDQRLVVQGEQQVGFDDVAVNQRCAHAEERRVGEDDAAFRHRPDVAPEVEVGEVIEEGVAEHPLAAQEGDVFFAKTQVLQVIQHLAESGEDGVTPAIRDFPEEVIEVGDFILPAFVEMALRHGQFVEVGQEGAVINHGDFLVCQ